MELSANLATNARKWPPHHQIFRWIVPFESDLARSGGGEIHSQGLPIGMRYDEMEIRIHVAFCRSLCFLPLWLLWRH